MKIFTFLPLAMFISVLSCTESDSKTDQTEEVQETSDSLSAVFNPIPAAYNQKTVSIPEGFAYQTLFAHGDTVQTTDGLLSGSKGNHDCIVFLPNENDDQSGRLFVGHETKEKNEILGDGGGASILSIAKKDGEWSLQETPTNVDYSSVGFTANNCGGKNTPMGTILTAEETFPVSNDELYYLSDLSDYDARPRYQNFGWMTEVDPNTAKAIAKRYGMGRYAHEDALCMPDKKTVYLTNDAVPACLFKFVADKAGDYSEGTLHAFKELENDGTGEWIALPRDMEVLLDAKGEAIKRGASMYVRHEWMTLVNGKIYITETGYDTIDFSSHVQAGGHIPSYLEEMKDENGIIHDFFGRVLVLDPENNQVTPYVNGGDLPDGGNFSNPDAMTSVNLKGTDYLVISEDLIGGGQNRTPKGTWTNEIYFLPISAQGGKREDLMRFMTAPNGSETTGSYFSPDKSTMFVNIQHPSADNPAPFNRSTTIAIQGF